MSQRSKKCTLKFRSLEDEKMFLFMILKHFQIRKTVIWVPYALPFYPVSKIYNSMVDRDLTPDEIEKEKKGFVEGEDCIDKMFTHINKSWKVIQK